MIKQLGADHPISIAANPRRVVVTFNGHKVGDTVRALQLAEATYPAVNYIPREDVNMSLLERTSHLTHCPYKGDAAYFTIKAGDQVAENGVWSYETPHAAVAEIAGFLAFYPNRVTVSEDHNHP